MAFISKGIKITVSSKILAVLCILLINSTSSAHPKKCSDSLSLNLPITASTQDSMCGPACFNSMFKRFLGWAPGDVPLAYALGTLFQRTESFLIVHAARRLGFYASEQFGITIQDLKRYLKRDEVVYIEWMSEGSERWSLVEGYGEDHITLMDPLHARTHPQSYNRISFQEFLPLWNNNKRMFGKTIRVSQDPLLHP